MPNIPLPPPVRFPQPIIGPTRPVPLPSFATPKWEPIPIYREQVPTLNVNPSQLEQEQAEQETNKGPANPADTPQPQQPIEAAPLPNTRTVVIPIIDKEIPLPTTEVMVIAVTTAGVTATASVAATLFATAMIKRLIKILTPLFKTILKKLAKARGKQTPSWARLRLEPRQRIKDKRGMTAGS